MKNYFKSLIIATAISFGIVGCNNNENADAIGLDEQQENSFSGKTTINGHQLVYQVKALNELSFTTTVKIDDFTLQANVKYDNQSIDFDGKNAVLTLEQKETLLDLGNEISQYLFEDKSVEDFTMTEFTLLRLLEYWAKSPNGYAHSKRSVISNIDQPLKSRDEGITCIRKNTYVTAEYDDDSGNVRESILVNGSDCIGRCGSGCGSFFSLASAWTKDCLDHDRCGRVNGGSTNPFDSECGDEYAEAADDYLFGVIRGCRG
ncbi:hypothetical protein [Tenacibaculum sp. M341]|uniref:hypothetical protein n=1 Tax=Tenacibaculum sp. M341 TaxID=2530339 RepID=UPI001052DD0B|nr:hypothetical protein [Tenacibaculum sp. M341]TCI91315.1 hypothetical protein EYW44_10185 [Tenacibaculum sp. M341]